MRSPFPVLAALVLSLSLAACAPAAPQPAASDPPGPEQSAASEEARPLTLDELLAMAEEDRFGQADFLAYPNKTVNFQDFEGALNYYVTFTFPYEGDTFTLDVSLMKNSNELSAIYFTRASNHDSLLLYDGTERFQHVVNRDLAGFLSYAADIHDEISYTVPDGLEEQPYYADQGFAGACLLTPDAYEVYKERAPDWWRSAGAVSRFYTEDLLRWEGNSICAVEQWSNKTSNEDLGPLDGLCAPAFLTKTTHDLYTNNDLMELEQAGVDLDTLDTASEYWDVYLARPGDTVGYLFRLNAKHYTQQDAVDFAKTMAYLD